MNREFKSVEEVIPHLPGHTFRQVSTSRSEKRGQDTDIYTYEALNEAGEVVATYELSNSMSIYPPQKIHQSYKKL
jgi:hypothetical protein